MDRLFLFFFIGLSLGYPHRVLLFRLVRRRVHSFFFLHSVVPDLFFLWGGGGVVTPNGPSEVNRGPPNVRFFFYLFIIFPGLTMLTSRHQVFQKKRHFENVFFFCSNPFYPPLDGSISTSGVIYPPDWETRISLDVVFFFVAIQGTLEEWLFQPLDQSSNLLVRPKKPNKTKQKKQTK